MRVAGSRRAGPERGGCPPDPRAASHAARVITIADHHAADYGVRFTGADPSDRAAEALPQLAALMADGQLIAPVWHTYPLAQAAPAHAHLESRRNHGKIILLPLASIP